MDGLARAKGIKIEQDYVKSTYDAIAEDFSSTRYKKWPKVDKFLQSLTKSSLMLDVGCGNGKYLDNSKTFNIGCDISLNLLKICRGKGFEVVLCDITRLPFRDNTFDAVICIAVIHHITTSTRRQKCLSDIVALLHPVKSRFLVQVWSFEQQLQEGNPYIKSRDAGESNHIMIDDDIGLPLHKNRTPFVEQDILVPFQLNNSHDQKSSKHLRYYHVFKQGELEHMFDSFSDISIIQSYYDKGNWCMEIEKDICRVE